MEKLASRNARRILTDSESSAAEIRKHLKVRPGAARCDPLAGTARPGVPTGSEGRRPDLILALGNRLPHKNFAGLVRAMALVEESARPTLVVTGSRGNDPLVPVVKELGLEKWVDLRSWVSAEELESLFSSATAMVMPSFCDASAAGA